MKKFLSIIAVSILFMMINLPCFAAEDTSLLKAAEAGDAGTVAKLLSEGADINQISPIGANALTSTVWSTGDTHDPANTVKIIQMLLDAGIDINSGEVRDASSDYNAGGNNWNVYINPIWYAAGSSGCSADVLEFMLNKGCIPSRAFAINEANGERQDFGVDDLIDAVKKSKSNKTDRTEYNRIMKILKDAKDKSKAAVPAVAKAPEPAAQEKKPEPAAPKPKTQKPVVKKPEPKQSEPAEAAPEKTSYILSKTEATEMLRKSVTDGNKENFYRALVMGADINAADAENKTPLILAVMSNSYEMTEVLIHKGAKVNVKTKGGNTPLSLAKDLGAKDIEQALLKAGAKN